MNTPPARNNGEPPFCGVIFGGGDKAISHVPLLRSVIDAVVIDVSCRVTVTQTYQNASDEPTLTARYVFPVPSRAAICAFSMMTGDNRLIYAKAKDKIEATKEFEAAVDEKRAAALQEQVSGDIFRMSLGSIPAGGTISTKTVFVMDLMNDDFLSNKVQLLLPLALAQRYGTLPEQLKDAKGNTGLIDLRIKVEIQMSGRIVSVTSPSHEQGLRVKEYTTHYGRPSRRRVTAKLRSTTYLDRDFELVIEANELERSRCFVEQDPRLPGTIALQLMMIPHFDLPRIPEQEYLFLIDKSGSMAGERIEIARQSVILLLQCLPPDNTVFNIFQFSTDYAHLWPQSKVYDDSNKQEAIDYVSRVYASGGTNLGAAMRAFLDSRRTSTPTAAFVLTDGEVSGEEEIALKAIRDNISTSSNAPLRLFVLGIGNTVSSDVCQRLAAAGSGEYLLAVSKESILSKCTSLVRASKTSTITDVSVNWMADISSGPGSSSHPLIQQSPPELHIPEAYPFIRSVYFAIIATKTVPKQVVIRGKVDGKEEFIHVDVESTKFGRKLSEPPFIHTLAARRLIRDLEEGDVKGKRSETDQRKEIVRLGEYYQLASSHTSFVAVDYGEVHLRHQNQQQSPNPFMVMTSLVSTIWQYFTSPTSLFRSSTAGGRPKQGPVNGLPGGYTPEGTSSEAPSESDTEYSDGSEDGGGDDDDDDWATQDSSDTLSTLSSLESYSSDDTGRPARRSRHSGSKHRQNQTLPPQVPYAPPPPAPPTKNRAEKFKPLPINPRAVTLIQQMSTSGSFALTDTLGEIVGRDALEEARSWGDEELAATALAMVYLKRNLGDYLELFQVLMEKGMEFVKNHPNGGMFNEMLNRAQMIFQP